MLEYSYFDSAGLFLAVEMPVKSLVWVLPNFLFLKLTFVLRAKLLAFVISSGASTKKWLILGVSLIHLVESRDLFFLKAEVVDNNLQWDVLKNMRQIKSYDDMFQAMRTLTVQIFSK